jgi:hypothetical protein
MDTNLPPILEAKLADFRRRVWTVKLAEGLLAALFGVVLSYLLVFALDRAFETPGWLRLSILLAGAAALGVGVPLKWHRWVWRQRRLEDAARLLRRTFPRLGDQLLGIVELARLDHAAAGRSERLVQAAMAQAADAVKNQDFTHAVPDARHRQWAWTAAAALALAGAAFALTSDAARNAVARWLEPLGHVERYTFAQVEPLPAKLVVPYAEPFHLPVRLSRGTRWSPAEGWAKISGQPWVEAKLSAGAYPLAFPPQKQDAELGVSLGDVRKDVRLEPRTRPELTELAVKLRLPAYLGYQSEPEIKVSGGSVNVLRGAQASFAVKANRPLAAAELDGRTQAVNGAEIVTAYEPIAGNTERKFTWKDHDGLTPRDPLVLKVEAVADEPPRIIARRDAMEEVVLDSEVVTFDLNASDDFGVKQVGLSWVGSAFQEDGKTPVTGEKVSAVGAAEKRELDARATFCATREGVEPQTLQVCAWADDYLPGRPHVRSAAFVLHVLNKTDHALWLTEQFGKWLEVAKESYERELQLHETNKELRALSPEDLDRPENRRRVSQQAAAENANAARLDSLTQSGRSLVEQATKNDEFDAARLESWATMLKSLKDIAANRMPSVSDLLKQTASAPGGKLAAAAPNSAPNPGGPPPQPQPGGATPPPNAPTTAGAAKTALSVSHGGTLPSVPAPAPPVDPNATPKPAAPSIADNLPGFSKPPEPKPADPNAAPKPPGGGKLRLPVTTLAAAPDKKKGDDGPPPPESPAQQKMETAVTEQKDLLAEFAKVSDQLSQILSSLEASTFVKRFKAASQKQMTLASNISKSTLDAFGVEHEPLPAAKPIATTAKDQSEVVRIIQSDLDAYNQRKQDTRFKNILDEMKKTEIVRALALDGEKVSDNLSGQSLAGSEFWADTLDRWGEELVGASKCKSSSTCSGDSLPPEIVLKVMQALRDEMHLRDQTRETENTRPALDAAKYDIQALPLGEKQAGIGVHTQSAIEDIQALPNGEETFAKEIKLLDEVVSVMAEARGILATPDTGAPAIAAETEAIELLLQSKRLSPKGGGGGGSNPGGGGRAATASSAALADLGPGSDAASVAVARPVGQATGHAGKEFPDEFKTGLDAYFNLLEGQSARR